MEYQECQFENTNVYNRFKKNQLNNASLDFDYTSGYNVEFNMTYSGMFNNQYNGRHIMRISNDC